MAQKPQYPFVESLAELAGPVPAELPRDIYERDSLLTGDRSLERMRRAYPPMLFEHAIDPVYPGAYFEIASVLDAMQLGSAALAEDFPEDSLLETVLARFDEYVQDHHGIVLERQVDATKNFGRLATATAQKLSGAYPTLKHSA